MSWIEERCQRDANAWQKTTDLFQDWKNWAIRAEEFVGDMRRFTQTLEDRGFKRSRTRGGKGFVGLKLAIPPTKRGRRGEWRSWGFEHTSSKGPPRGWRKPPMCPVCAPLPVTAVGMRGARGRARITAQKRRGAHSGTRPSICATFWPCPPRLPLPAGRPHVRGNMPAAARSVPCGGLAWL